MSNKVWLFINPPTGKYIRETRCQAPVKGLMATVLRAPVDLGYIAGAVSVFHSECYIKDYPAENLDWTDFEKDLVKLNPDYVVINTTTFSLDKDLFACKIAKEYNSKIITIAKGAIFYADGQKILENENYLDIAVIDDEEMGFYDIASGKSLSEIPGIIFKVNENVVKNERRKLIDLSMLPKPRLDLIHHELYIRPDTGKMQATVMVGRGCSGNCIYCVAPLVGGKNVRYRPASEVIQEIETYVYKYGIENFYFLADAFTWDGQWVMEFCNQIAEKKINILWLCNSRADCLHKEVLTAMKNAGCWGLSIGAETGNEKMLKRIGKNISLKQVEDAVSLCRMNGMVCLVHFMIGFPWDTEETVKETIKFAKKLKSGLIEFNIVTPLPGTPLYKIAIEHGLMHEDADLNGCDYKKACVKTFELSGDDLERLRNKAFKSLYLNIGFGIRSLSYIKSINQLVRCFVMFLNKIFLILNPDNAGRSKDESSTY